MPLNLKKQTTFNHQQFNKKEAILNLNDFFDPTFIHKKTDGSPSVFHYLLKAFAAAFSPAMRPEL